MIHDTDPNLSPILAPVSLDPNDLGESKPRRFARARKILWAGGIFFVLYLAFPHEAQAQFGDIFSAIFSTIQSDMGASLKAINQMTQELQQLHQEIVWPLGMLNSARGFVSNSITTYRSYMTQIFTLSSPSATLPNPQQLETILHSRTSTQIPALQSSYITNYGTIPLSTQASSQDRLMMDMDDALAQQNLKTTLIADQGQDVILATANQMENQVAVSTPGSNPFLTAQAQVANLRCQAYMQKMLAAELRQEAGRIAHDNVLTKRRAASTASLSQSVSGSLTQP
ncbi:hypothetical protein [Edaphobacter dinghuensis]|uniref:Uncharacterized protein n=1 Tax=Edaphobacter dinghuensis TaxID=1560005 RepID=A0A917MBH2_9BACT|nr:hypothetical protein [Edaphobacter dinghuensis]GGG87227.1 hypothetical protein GCM10011585_34080 [Edaphobacter dinghuensis]